MGYEFSKLIYLWFTSLVSKENYKCFACLYHKNDEKREYISVAQFGLVAYLKTKFESNAKSVASRRGWDLGRMDNPLKSL